MEQGKERPRSGWVRPVLEREAFQIPKRKEAIGITEVNKILDMPSFQELGYTLCILSDYGAGKHHRLSWSDNLRESDRTSHLTVPSCGTWLYIEYIGAWAGRASNPSSLRSGAKMVEFLQAEVNFAAVQVV